MGIGVHVNRILRRVGYVLVRDDRPLPSTASGATPIGAPEPGSLEPKPSDRSHAGPKPAVAATSGGRLEGPTMPNEPLQNCAGLAPPFDVATSTARFASQIEEFQRTGITVLPTDAAVAARWRDQERFDRDVGNRHSAWDWAGNAVTPYSKNIRSGLPSQDVTSTLERLFTGQDFEEFFLGVLGCRITVGNCRLVESPPHAGSGVGPQSWHQDGCPPGVIRGVLYLTDVDIRTGPFQYKDSSGTEHTMLGKTGDLLIFDAMRLPHRAMPPEARTRTAIDLVFMPRLPGQDLRVMIAGMNHWPADPFFYDRPAERPIALEVN